MSNMNDELVAGDTLDFVDDVPDYLPADGWTLKYRLVPRFASPTQLPVDITATTYNVTQYRVQAAASVTAGWKPGVYTWSRWVEQAGPIRQSLGSGELKVLQDPQTASQGYDGRSFARKRLELVEAALLAFADSTVKSYAIGIRTVTRADLSDLQKERSALLWEVSNEDAAAQMAAGLGNPRAVGVRFRRV